MSKHVASALALGTLWLCFGVLGGCTTPEDDTTTAGTTSDAAGTPLCEPSCTFKECGDDGCGGVCGVCGAGTACENFACVLSTANGPDATTTPDTPAGQPQDSGGSVDTGGPQQPEDVAVDPDLDGDSILNEQDNCETVYNPNQADLDDDGQGDACDADIDDDGYINELDCDPAAKQIHPNANERCNNAIDDNCNGMTDEEDAWDCTDYFVDGDSDGAGDQASLRCLCVPDGDHNVKIGGDCADNDPEISPLVREQCDDIDNNCNMQIDEGCDDDSDGYCDLDMVVSDPWPAICPKGPGDCYDYSAQVSPDMLEIEADGLDNDCDGEKLGEPHTGPIVCDCDENCTGATPDAFMCAIDMCCAEYLLGASAGSPNGDSIAGAWGAITQWGSVFNDLVPFKGNTYAIMGSGQYGELSHQSTLPGSNSSPDPFSPENMEDVVEFTAQLKAPPAAEGFSIDYIFMSAEYHEWVGSEFNDKFYIILQAPSTNNGQPTVINFAPCLNENAYYDIVVSGSKMCYIAINASFTEPCPCDSFGCDSSQMPWSCVSSPAGGNVCWPTGAPTGPPTSTTDLSGTGHDCGSDGSSTGWLTTTWPIEPDEEFTITFHIHDTSDELFDSQVLIDNFQWLGEGVEGGTASKN